MNLTLEVSISFLSPLVTCQMPFLSHNQQCQSTAAGMKELDYSYKNAVYDNYLVSKTQLMLLIRAPALAVSNCFTENVWRP